MLLVVKVMEKGEASALHLAYLLYEYKLDSHAVYQTTMTFHQIALEGSRDVWTHICQAVFLRMTMRRHVST